MSAGLPGLGLGGLFFIVSALVAPLVELVRTVQGRSSRRAWRAVGRQFALAVAMIGAVDLTLRATFIGLSVSGIADAPSSGGATVLPLTPIGITGALVALVLASAKAMQLALSYRELALGYRRAGTALAISGAARRRPLASVGAVVGSWLAVLTIGVSELSNVSSGRAAVPAPAADAASLGRGDDRPRPTSGSEAGAPAASLRHGPARDPASGPARRSPGAPHPAASAPAGGAVSEPGLPGTGDAGHALIEVARPSAGGGEADAGPGSAGQSGAAHGPPEHAGAPEDPGARPDELSSGTGPPAAHADPAGGPDFRAGTGSS